MNKFLFRKLNYKKFARMFFLQILLKLKEYIWDMLILFRFWFIYAYECTLHERRKWHALEKYYNLSFLSLDDF